MVAMLVIPLWAVSGSVINYAQLLASIIESGAYQIPPPEPTVREWPVIGHKAYDLWLKSSENLPDVIEQFQDQIVSISKVLLESVAGFGFTMLQFLFSKCFPLIVPGRK